MDKKTIEIMQLAQALMAADKIYSDLKRRGVVLGVYFNDYEGKPSIQLGQDSGSDWGDRSRRDDKLDEISTDIFGVKIFSLVYREEEEQCKAGCMTSLSA